MPFEQVKRIFPVLLVLSVLLLPSCSQSKKNEKPIIAVSTAPQRFLIEKIAGQDLFDIVVVMPSGDNPETFEPSPVGRINVENSDIYFSTGLLPFEKKLTQTISDKNKTVNTSEGIELIYGTHSHVHKDGKTVTHATADPHVSLSVRNSATMAKNIAKSLIDTYPEHADLFSSNLGAYLVHLDSLDNNFKERISASGARAFLIWHPSLTYFARDYGLEQIAASSETKELSVASLKRIIDNAKEHGVTLMFFQREFDSRQAEVLSDETGTKLIPISPMAYDWEKELSDIVNTLAGD